MGMIKLRGIDKAAMNFSKEHYVHEAFLQVQTLLRLHSVLMTRILKAAYDYLCGT